MLKMTSTTPRANSVHTDRWAIRSPAANPVESSCKPFLYSLTNLKGIELLEGDIDFLDSFLLTAKPI
jgi:hypothetical protein